MPEPIRPNLPPSPSSGAIANNTGVADESYNVHNQLSPHGHPFSQSKTNQSDLLPPPSQTADVWSGAPNIPDDQLPVYENVRPKQRRSAGSNDDDVGLAQNMASFHVGGEPHVPTNADPQYRTEPDQPVFPPPSPSHEPQVNSIPNIPSVSTTNEDYSWMYDKSHQQNSEPPLPDDAPTPMQNVVKFPGGSSEREVEGVDDDLTSNMDNNTVTPVSGSDSGNGSAALGSSELDVAVINIPPETTPHKDEEEGMIKPIIKFDKFPRDLSWDQI